MYNVGDRIGLLWINDIGVPGGISFIEVRDDLYAVDGVKQIHSLYIWGITPDKLALASHVAIGTYTTVAY